MNRFTAPTSFLISVSMLIVTLTCWVESSTAQSPVTMTFGQVGDTELKLDFFAAESDKPSPLVVWIHGGAWRAGDRGRCPIIPMTELGFSIASLDYRLSPAAAFPAQMHDIKAGIRFLRASADELGVLPEKIVIAGASAGGHLAALAGVTSGVEALEDTAMGHSDTSSSVAAIISLYGASNLQTILSQSTPHGLSVREPALRLFLGDLPVQKPDLARLASPVSHVDKNDPPLLLVHGDQDPQMPINQSHELHGTYKQNALPVEFQVLYGAAHGGKAFYTPEQLKRMAAWLRNALVER